MEKYEFDKVNLFEFFFGYRAVPYPQIILDRFKKDASVLQVEKYQFENLMNQDKETLLSKKGVKFYAKNSLGNIMYMPVTLSTDSKQVILENTVISLACKKTIVETPLVARKGTVKEEISIDDWEISIKGIIIGKNFYPETEVEELKNLFEENKALGINNVLTAMFLDDQEKVVIKSLELNDSKGMEHVQPFTMQMVSDTEFDLYIEA